MPVPKDNESHTPPSLPWRAASKGKSNGSIESWLSRLTHYIATIAAIGLACKGFLKVGTKSTETHGLDNFVKLLDERQDISQRERGLLTVSNHTSVYVLPV